MPAASQSRSQRTAAPNASSGSSTITTAPAGPSISIRPGTLRLRADPEAEREAEPSTQRRIQWAEDVIDNEGLGRKSSKVCCIYHKPREAGESSEESSDSSSSDSDSEPDTSRAQPANRRSNRQPREHRHDHDGEPCEHSHDQPDSKSKGKQKERKPSPNAYERVPKRKQPKEPK